MAIGNFKAGSKSAGDAAYGARQTLTRTRTRNPAQALTLALPPTLTPTPTPNPDPNPSQARSTSRGRTTRPHAAPRASSAVMAAVLQPAGEMGAGVCNGGCRAACVPWGRSSMVYLGVHMCEPSIETRHILGRSSVLFTPNLENVWATSTAGVGCRAACVPAGRWRVRGTCGPRSSMVYL